MSDHFKFWKIRRVPFEIQVKLNGQFDRRDWWDAFIGPAVLIGNPVKKVHRDVRAEITNPRLHYVAYSLRPDKPQPRRVVKLANQFTREEPWVLADPVLLLVPTAKLFDPEVPRRPEKGDHFVCYRVLQPRLRRVDVRLEDQFDVARKKIERIRELTPAYFAVPVRKRHLEGRAGQLVEPENHLAIYKVPPDRAERPLRVNTVNQFGEQKLVASTSAFLAVPSVKRGWDQG